MVVVRDENRIENVGEESVETNSSIMSIWVSVTLYIRISVNIKTNKTSQNLKNLSYSKHYTLWYYKEDIIAALEGIILH